jgi:hypothetical protein
MPFAVTSGDRNTVLLRQACSLRWPGRQIAGLARVTRRPKATAASWLSGRRGMPEPLMQMLSEVIRHDAELLGGIAKELSRLAELKRSRGRTARGFQIVKDWDGSGVKRDARWRGGKGKTASSTVRSLKRTP